MGGKDKLLGLSQDDLLLGYFAMQAKAGPMGGLGPGFSPVVDGVSLPRHPYSPDSTPLSANIPLLIGRTHHEAAVFMLGQAVSDETALRAAIERSAPRKADQVLSAYRAAYPTASLRDLAILVATDSGTGKRTRELADLKSTQPAPVYVYRFHWETKVLGGAFKATHGMDTSFIFNNTDIDPLVGKDPSAGPLAERVSRSWAAFMRSGSPGAPGGLGKWPKYSAGRRNTLVINNDSQVEIDPNGGLLDFF